MLYGCIQFVALVYVYHNNYVELQGKLCFCLTVSYNYTFLYTPELGVNLSLD